MNIEKNHGTSEQMRENIIKIESVMKDMTDHHIHIEPKHYFAPGIYMREITIPMGVTLTGHIHKTEHMCILSKGRVSVWTDEGMKELTASSVVHSLVGMKRVMFAHEESVWINVHHNPTNEKDLTKIDSIFVAETFEEYYLTSKKTFDDVLKVSGVSKELMTLISEKLDDQIEYDQNNISIGDSIIHGKGVFSKDKILSGSVIALARIGDKRTPVGRYCNHSGTPNAKMAMNSIGDVELIALTDIESSTEILTDYFDNFVNSRITKLGGK